jgi:8-oxo-dGTP pyrophosphatase MutT (NUDIX family)
MPGAMVALQPDDRRVLLTKRTDDGTWCLPAGAAELGGSFARTAIDELAEETGLEVLEADLVPFGCLSEAEAHTIHYPNGDVTHCFALCFLARTWQGDVRLDGDETTDAKFVDMQALPEPLHPPTAQALELLSAYHRSGAFQVR